MTPKQERVIKALSLDIKKKTARGWLFGFTCPWCSRDDKFGIKIKPDSDINSDHPNHVSFNCWHGSCGESGHEFKLMEKLGKLEIVLSKEYIGAKINIENKLKRKVDKTPEGEYEQATIKPKPLGWRRTMDSEYLNSRGFTPQQYEKCHVGRTKLDRKLRDYVVFLIMEDGKNRGYVARSTLSNEQMSAHEKKTGQKYPKYRNESGVNFGNLLLGFDEIGENTHTIILVEGPTDKFNIDRLLSLYDFEEIKCLCTFGKKVSDLQIKKIKSKIIENIILLYDPDAIDSSKKYGFELLKYFKVKVGFLSDKDPGDLNEEELLEILSDLHDPLNFSVNFLSKKLI